MNGSTVLATQVPISRVGLISTGNFDVGLRSLVAETRKIPVDLRNNDKLTMSRIEEFAVDSRFFHKMSANNVVQKRNDVIYEAEEDENNNAVPQEFGQYRSKSKLLQEDPFANEFSRGDEELDRLVKGQDKGREAGKWSKNMGSVDSEIGREIEKIMKDQRRAPSRDREDGERPSTKLSNAGKNSLSDKYGFGADEFTLKSEEPGTVKGAYGTRNSFDLDRINQRNDKVLERFRGVGSLASDDVSRLDDLVRNYPE